MSTPIYPGFENDLRLVLKSDGVAYSLASVTKMELCVIGSGAVISSTNLASDTVLWAKGGYATGEVRIYPGLASMVLPSGICTAYLSIYDSVYDLGFVWGSIEFTVTAVTKGT